MNNEVDRTRIAAALGGLTLVWYGMPDVVRSRPLRALAKTCLLAASAGCTRRLLEQTGPAQSPRLPDEPAGLATATAVLGLGTLLGIRVEKAAYAFGESRRARGRRLAHTLPALGWGALAAATMLIRDEDLTGRVTH